MSLGCPGVPRKIPNRWPPPPLFLPNPDVFGSKKILFSSSVFNLVLVRWQDIPCEICHRYMTDPCWDFFCIFYLRIDLRRINHSCRHTCRSSHGSYGILIATKHLNIFSYIYICMYIWYNDIYIYISQCQGFIYFTVYDVGEFICHFQTWDSY